MLINSFKHLIQHISQGSIVITPNARLSKSILERYDASQTDKVWPSAKVYPFNYWLQQLWLRYCSYQQEQQPRLLSDAQNSYLWLELIKRQAHTLYNPNALAQQLQQAWTHCLAWQVDINTDQFEQNEETLFFQIMLKQYLKLRANTISACELIGKIQQAIIKQELKLPSNIIFAFFDEFTPQQALLLNTIDANPESELIYFDEAINDPIEVKRIEAQNQQDEIHSVITWITQKLAQDPNQQLGIVVPNLQQCRAQLEQQLLEKLPKTQCNISMGKPLSNYPIVSNALSLLALSDYVFSIEQLHLLCHSTFIGKYDEEKEARQDLYIDIKNTTEKNIYYKIAKSKLNALWLANSLEKFITLLHAEKKRSLTQWGQCFIQALELIAFPGEDILTSEEYQIHLRFIKALKEFETITDPAKQLSKHQALSLLQWHLENIIYQPQGEQTNIHFIGLLESLGLPFDAVWIMGMDEQQLPQKLMPSPFLPLKLQRDLQMPHASEERESKLAKKYIERLTKHSKDITFSFYQEHESTTLGASPFIQHYPLITAPLATKQSTLKNYIETYLPQYKLPFKTDALKNLKGGSYLIKEQAQCPFRAFSKFRLNIPEPRQSLDGLDNLDKGILIHKALEIFWLKIKSQQRLLELKQDGSLEQEITLAVEASIRFIKLKKNFSFNKLYSELELRRVKKIIMLYLELEMARPPFTIKHIEFSINFIASKLNISLRLDRVDELENGDWLIIDYKTGSPSISHWFSERLTEPQLPIYALTEPKIKGIVYGQLQQRDIKNKGVCAYDMNIKGIESIEKKYKTDWQEQLKQWQHAVHLLADEYIDGEISATPNQSTLCTGCVYRALCGKNR